MDSEDSHVIETAASNLISSPLPREGSPGQRDSVDALTVDSRPSELSADVAAEDSVDVADADFAVSAAVDTGSEVAAEQEEAISMNRSGRRRRRRLSSSSSDSPLSSSTSSSSSSSESSMGSPFVASDIETTAEDDAQDQPIPEVLTKSAPKCHNSIITDMINRELHQSARGFHRRVFTENRMGSLSLTSRLILGYKLEGHRGCVNSLHFNESGSLLASGSDDLKIIIWDWARKKQMAKFNSGHQANVFQTKYLPMVGDAHIVSSSRDGQVRLAELDPAGACRATRKVAQHKGPVHKIALSPACPQAFLCAGEDGVVSSVDVREAKPTKLLMQKEGERKIAIYSVDANPVQSNLFCTSGKDKYIRIYDRRQISDGNAVKKFYPHHLAETSGANVTSAVFSHDGEELIGSYNDDDIYLFQVDHSDGADYRKRFQGHRNSATVKGVNFYGPRSEYVISGSDCGNVFLWSKDTEAIVHMFAGDVSGVVNVLEPHPNLPYLATSGLDPEVKIWSPLSQNEVDWKEIKQTVMKNTKDQQNHRLMEPDAFGGQMLWVLLRQIRRTEERRRRAAMESDPNPAEEDNDEHSSNEEASDEEDSNVPGGIQCPTS